MRPQKVTEPSRRRFLNSIMPACALACLGCSSALALGKSTSPNIRKALQEDVHPFDAEFPRKLTFRQVMEMRSRESIRLGKWMKEEMGGDNALEFLKKYTSQKWLEFGKSQARESADNSLRQYTQQFRNPDTYKNILVMEIVEDTDTAFGLKVTECIWPTIFLPQKAGDLGTAFICHGDYAWAEGFNPKIKLVRTKTIMQGDPICNHRYIWQG